MTVRLMRLGVAAALLAGGPAAADPVRLTLANAFSTYDVRVAIWAGGINTEAAGVLEIVMHDSASVVGGDQLKQLTQVRDGTVDIAVLVTNYHPAEFPIDDLAQLPGLFRNSTEGSLTMWRLQQQGLLPGYGDFAVLALNTSANSTLHTEFSVRSLDRLRGAKIRVGSTVLTPLPEEFGAEPVFMPIADVREGFVRGSVDGVITVPVALFSGTRIAEVARYHLAEPLGQFSVALIMNKDRYAGLSAAAKAVLAEHTGEALVRAWAMDVDAQDQDSLDRLKAMPGHEVTRLSIREGKRWRSAIDTIIHSWIELDPRRRLAYDAAMKVKVTLAVGR